MKKLKVFRLTILNLEVGMYVSRIDDDIVTYDIRMVKPNGGRYISSASLHTIEHLFATFARSSGFSDKVIYVGPMGCRTGFICLFVTWKKPDAIKLVLDSMRFIKDYKVTFLVTAKSNVVTI